jgi:DNA gyrase subunit A
MKLNEDRGSLVGGLVVTDTDQVIAIKMSGQIIRSSVAEVSVQGRDTMGVKFVGLKDDDLVAQIALYPDTDEESALTATTATTAVTAVTAVTAASPATATSPTTAE